MMPSSSQRPMCPNPIHCGGVYNPSHRAQYRHQCPYGKGCSQQYVEAHTAEFAHDVFQVEQRSKLPPVTTAPQVVPGPAPVNRPLPQIAGMEGAGPDKPVHDPIRGNRGPDTYVMPQPSPNGNGLKQVQSQTYPAVPQTAVVPPAPGSEATNTNGKSAAPVPESQTQFVVTASPPPFQPQPMMFPQYPMQTGAQVPGAFPMMPMASPYGPGGAFIPMGGLGGVPTPAPGSFPMMPLPGQPGFAQAPPQPASPYPGYYLHQAGK